MTPVVIDASVALKWLIDEPGRDAAAELLTEYQHQRADVVAPSVIVKEVASALSKAFRMKRITHSAARNAFRKFKTYEPMLTDDRDLMEPAFDLSMHHQISFWDSLYLALAIHRRADLLTADARFHRSMERHYPYVRLLG